VELGKILENASRPISACVVKFVLSCSPSA
jgi:hypothetical protein